MTIRSALVAAVAGLAIAANGALAPSAAADPTVDTFGGWNRLIDDGGAVITIWKVSDLKPSTDTIPGYPLAGKLWEVGKKVVTYYAQNDPAKAAELQTILGAAALTSPAAKTTIAT